MVLNLCLKMRILLAKMVKPIFPEKYNKKENQIQEFMNIIITNEI